MPVDTAKVEGRRKLDYASYQELLADADRMSSGPLTVLGNWSPGRIFKHLALVYNGSIDGFAHRASWPMRFLARLLRKKFLSSPMPAGFKLPAEAEQRFVPDETGLEEGLAALHSAVARLQRESHRAEHPVFGPMSREQWDQLHLKHASLHMSFLVPEN